MKSEEIANFKVTSDIVSWFDDVMISFLQNFGAHRNSKIVCFLQSFLRNYKLILNCSMVRCETILTGPRSVQKSASQNKCY